MEFVLILGQFVIFTRSFYLPFRFFPYLCTITNINIQYSMKQNLLQLLFLALLPTTASANVVINKETFPDDAFREYVMSTAVDID